ncbi:hypothetical protein BDF22DRAFT_743488 [Syncephalis plumigaleata]|nr:hypothetical protein BDF22DRAFT_743488 [Syncephalis plumigaleata]
MLYNYSPLDRDWSQLTSEGYGMEASQPTTTSSLADTNATSTNGFTFHDPPATYLNEASASALPPSTRRQREEQERHRFNYNNRTNDTGNTAYRSSRTLLSAMGRMQREQIQESNEDDADNNTEDDINTEADTTQSSMHNTSQYSGDGHGTAMEGMRLGSLLMEPTLHLRDHHSFTRENTMAEYTEGDSSVLADNSTLTDQDGMENGGEDDDDDDDEQATLRRRHPLGRSTTRQSTTLHDEQSSSDNNSNNSNNEQQCRICFAGPEESNVLGQLISPCLCKGTMRYVHLECLNAWRNAGHSRSAFFECNQCGYRYSFARTRIATIIQHPVVLFLITIMVFVLVTLLAGFITKLIFRISLGGDYNYFNENVSSDLLVTDNEGNIWRRISIGDFDDDDTGQLVLLRTREEELDRLARLTANQDNSGDDDYNDADGLLGIMEDPARLEQALSFTNIDLFHMIMGLVTVSVIGFLQFVIGIAYIGPLPLFGNMHTRVNNLRGGGGRQGGGSGFDLLLVIVILIGILRAFKTIYQSISTIVQRNIERLGQRILDVPKTD